MLNCCTVRNAVVIPVAPLGTKPWRGVGGVFDKNGLYVASSALVRNWGEIITAPEYQEPVQHLGNQFIFGGYIYVGHFGHFLLESCARLWFAREHPDIPILWAMGQRFSQFHREIFEILGIRNKHTFILEPTSVEYLKIPESGYRIQDQFSPLHADFLASWDGLNSQPGKRVWLSRTGLAEDRGRVLSEPLIEQRLQSESWEIFRPECHSVAMQLEVLSKAEHVAGFMGSAFHSLVLLKNPPNRITIFARGGENLNYSTIAKTRSLNQEFVRLPLKCGVDKGASTQLSIANLALILNKLDIKHNSPMWGAKGKGKRIKHATAGPLTRLISHLLTSMDGDRFLDLGAASEQLFLGLKTRTKVAVAPNFDFDYRPHVTSEIEFYEIPIVEYFTFHANRRKFDVILLNSICSCESSFRDFCSSIRHSIDRTVWLIHHSDIRDAEIDAHETESYKLVFAIHDFFPNMSLETIKSHTVSQTLIWFEPRTEFKPLFNSFNSITRQSSSDVRANVANLVQTGEVEAFERAVKASLCSSNEFDVS